MHVHSNNIIAQSQMYRKILEQQPSLEIRRGGCGIVFGSVGNTGSAAQEIGSLLSLWSMKGAEATGFTYCLVCESKSRMAADLFTSLDSAASLLPDLEDTWTFTRTGVKESRERERERKQQRERERERAAAAAKRRRAAAKRRRAAAKRRRAAAKRERERDRRRTKSSRDGQWKENNRERIRKE